MPPSARVAVAIVLLVACTPTGAAPVSDAGGAPSSKCARFGQTCELSPGKLGTCVERTSCTGDDCLICQSQH
jgi:hypothetical protein